MDFRLNCPTSAFSLSRGNPLLRVFVDSVVFCAVLSGLASASAATRTAVSPSFIDINTAINGGTDSKGTRWRPLQDGDTLLIPAGSATWNEKLTINNKGVTIKGAGIGKTTITADPMAKSGTILQIQRCGSKPVSISDISWIGNSVGNSATVLVGNNIRDVNTNYRLHHMYFQVNRRGVMLFGRCEGVIDHCTFRCSLNASCQGVTVWGNAQYLLVPNNTAKSFPPGTAWTTPAVFGDPHRAFIEDCDFDFDYKNDAAVEGYYGAKYCVRHCTIKNSLVGNHGLDSGVSATHSFEVYDNVITWTSYPADRTIPGYNGKTFEARGGTGLYFNNKLVVPWLDGPHASQFNGHSVVLEAYRAVGYAVAGHGASGGFITGSNPYDGNKRGVSSASGFDPCGWPALESVGTTGPIVLHADHADVPTSPFYEWNNTYGVDSDHQTGGSYVQIGPGYKPVRASGTDLVIDSSDSTKVTSATRSFVDTGASAKDRVTSDVASWIHVKAGSGFTPGWHQIVRCIDNAAMLNKSPGKAGSTGGVWSEEWSAIVPSDIIKENRDYYRDTPKPDYTPYRYPHPLVGEARASSDNRKVVR